MISPNTGVPALGVGIIIDRWSSVKGRFFNDFGTITIKDEACFAVNKEGEGRKFGYTAWDQYFGIRGGIKESISYDALAPFLKNARWRHGMYAFMTTFNLLGGFMAFAEPSGIVHEYWTLTLHAFLWHMTLVFLGLYLIASGRGANTLRDYRDGVLTFLALCVIAFVINVTVNYGLGEHINMFFVGPQNSSLAVFKDIAERFGWYVSTLLYIPAVCLGAFIFFLPVWLFRRKKEKKS